MQTTRVYLEQGTSWVFACAIDWPGWCRRGKGEQAAIDALLDYTERYAGVAGPEFEPGELSVVGRVPGTMTTDFGAPDVVGEWDHEPLDHAEAHRQAGLLEAAWRAFDETVHAAPAVLRKGPRGGGRDRDAIVDHVIEAERSYGRKFGVKVPPRTPWPDQRMALVAAIRAGTMDNAWPPRYAVRRVAWHVLDHAWELQDKSS